MRRLQVGAGVLVDGHGQVLAVVDVEQHRGHRRSATGQEEVVRVGPSYAGTQDHAAAAAYLDVADQHRVVLRVDRRVRARVPPRHVEFGRRRSTGERAPPSSSRGSAPCRAAAPTGRRASSRPRWSSDGCPRVGATHLALLLLREGHGAQAEQLVDLEGVEERRLALRRQLGVVVEDDRRREHHRVLPGRCRPSTGKTPSLTQAAASGRAHSRRVEQREERSVARPRAPGGGHEGTPQPRGPVGPRSHPREVRFSTRTETSETAYGDSGCSTVVTTPTSSGSQVRTSRPTTPCSSRSSSVSDPPVDLEGPVRGLGAAPRA